jgi:MscS family membrane protein
MDKSTILKNFFLENYVGIIIILLVIFLTIIINYLVTVLFRKSHPRLKRSHRVWDDALILALYTPIKYGILINGFSWAIIIAVSYSKYSSIYDFIDPVRKIATILLLVWFFIRFIHEFEKNLVRISSDKKNRLDKTTLRAISQLLRLGVITVGGLIILQTFGIPLSGVIAFGGMSGIAVGFAAKDLLANFFGGLMIFLDRPFAIGDWIRSPDKEIEGTVEHIGWRLTLIRTFDKRPLYVPNAIFSNVSIENAERMQNRRIKATIGLRYDDADRVDIVLKEVEEMLRTHPDIDQNKIFFAKLVDFGPSSLDFLLYTFTKTTDWLTYQKVQQDVFLKIFSIIRENGAEIAYPTSRRIREPAPEEKK